MAQTVTNPRFPHICRIYRQVDADSFSDGEEKEIYSGECRKSGSTNIRTFNTGTVEMGKVDTTDYRISMPGIVSGILKGDLVEVSDPLLQTSELIRVVFMESSQLGIHETYRNGHKIVVTGGTAVYCNSVSN